MVFAQEDGMTIQLSQVRLPLAHFTLDVDVIFSGRVTALFGPSGSGKTSLLELIAGLRKPAAGKITIADTLLNDVQAKVFLPPERRAIGYVPQEGALFPHLSVRENLRYGFVSERRRPAGLSFEHVVAVLEIGELAERRVQTLSGGEKQRVALGRALLSVPQLLLLDEPLAGLDEPLRDRLLPYLTRVRDEFQIPMLYVTHSADEVVALCDDVIVLAEGKILERGKPADLFVSAPTPRYIKR
jgi:molybdate transport system ATP-binding protein